MKKLLMGSIVLTVFSISIILFQFSCRKVATAQTAGYVLPVATTSTLGGVMVDGKTIKVDGIGRISTVNTNSQLNLVLYAVSYGDYDNASEYWTMNYDGTNPIKIPLVFSSNIRYSMNPRLSPDGKTIFFATYDYTLLKAYLYACSIDGTNLKTLLVQNQRANAGANIQVAGAY